MGLSLKVSDDVQDDLLCRCDRKVVGSRSEEDDDS